MNFDSNFHALPLLCELMTLVRINQHNSFQVFIFHLGFLILLPLLVVFISIVFAFALYFDSEFWGGKDFHRYTIEYKLKPSRYDAYGHRVNPVKYYFKLFLFYLFCLIYYSLVISICLAVGCAISIVTIIPAYIYSLYTMGLIVMQWRKTQVRGNKAIKSLDNEDDLYTKV